MQLRFIEQGTIMEITKGNNGAQGSTYQAVFLQTYTDNSFVTDDAQLFRDFSLLWRADLTISFKRANQRLVFTGRVFKTETRGATHVTIIEQISPIKEQSAREFSREEIMVNILLYELTEEQLEQSLFSKPSPIPVFSDVTYDLSAGGFCVGTREQRPVMNNPYFLAEFMIGDSYFLLPSKIVRRGNSPQTSLYRYDYGFMFVYDKIPHEKERLITAIFKHKLSAFQR